MPHGIRKAALEKVVARGSSSRPNARPPARLSDKVIVVPNNNARHRHSTQRSIEMGAEGRNQAGSCVLVDPEHSNFDNAGYEIIQALRLLDKSWKHKYPKLSNVATWSLEISGPGAHVMNVTFFPDGYPAVAQRYVVVYKRMHKVDDPEFDPLANDAPIDHAVVKAMNEEAHAVRAGTLIHPTEAVDEPVPETGTGNNDPSSSGATNGPGSAGSPDVEEIDDDATEVMIENEVVGGDSDEEVFVAPLADNEDRVILARQFSQNTEPGADDVYSAAPVDDSVDARGADDSSFTGARFQWLKKRNTRLQTELALKDSNYESLKETLHEKSAEVVTLKDKLSDIESKALKLEQNLEALEIKLFAKEEELALSLADLSDKETKNIELNRQLDALQETLASKEKELDAKKIEASNLGRELKAAQVQLAEASGSSKSNAENERPVPIKLADGPLKRAVLSKQAKIDSLEKELTTMKASAKREKRKFDEELYEETSKRLKAEEEAASCKCEIAKLERINFELKCNKEKDGA